MMLAAKSLGLGSCWIHRAKEVLNDPEGKEILKSIGLTDEYEGVGTFDIYIIIYKVITFFAF